MSISGSNLAIEAGNVQTFTNDLNSASNLNKEHFQPINTNLSSNISHDSSNIDINSSGQVMDLPQFRQLWSEDCLVLNELKIQNTSKRLSSSRRVIQNHFFSLSRSNLMSSFKSTPTSNNISINPTPKSEDPFDERLPQNKDNLVVRSPLNQPLRRVTSNDNQEPLLVEATSPRAAYQSSSNNSSLEVSSNTNLIQKQQLFAIRNALNQGISPKNDGLENHHESLIFKATSSLEKPETLLDVGRKLANEALDLVGGSLWRVGSLKCASISKEVDIQKKCFSEGLSEDSAKRQKFALFLPPSATNFSRSSKSNEGEGILQHSQNGRMNPFDLRRVPSSLNVVVNWRELSIDISLHSSLKQTDRLSIKCKKHLSPLCESIQHFYDGVQQCELFSDIDMRLRWCLLLKDIVKWRTLPQDHVRALWRSLSTQERKKVLSLILQNTLVRRTFVDEGSDRAFRAVLTHLISTVDKRDVFLDSVAVEVIDFGTSGLESLPPELVGVMLSHLAFSWGCFTRKVTLSASSQKIWEAIHSLRSVKAEIQKSFEF